VTEPIDLDERRRQAQDAAKEQGDDPAAQRPVGRPSNDVYARVGDTVLQAAQAGVRRGETPEEIIRGIAQRHGVRLNVAELRLLLASRRVPS